MEIERSMYVSKSGYKKEVARYFIVKSIDLAESTGNEKYYCDWYKLHKLMYYAQREMLSRYDECLFDGIIRAHDCGPMIDGIDYIVLLYDFIPIRNKRPGDDRFLRCISFIFNDEQLSVLNKILRKYGKFDRDEIISEARADNLWKYCYKRKNDENEHPIIPNELIKKYFLLEGLSYTKVINKQLEKIQDDRHKGREHSKRKKSIK